MFQKPTDFQSVLYTIEPVLAGKEAEIVDVQIHVWRSARRDRRNTRPVLSLVGIINEKEKRRSRLHRSAAHDHRS